MTVHIDGQLRSNPAIVEHLGEFKKSSYNRWAAYERHVSGSDWRVLDVEGTKGKGQVDAHFDRDFRILSGTLKTPSGTEVPLVPGASLDGPRNASGATTF
jgi:hypothetical protein